jgi:hypothetical protein
MLHTRSFVVALICSVAVGAPAALTAQQSAAAYTVDALHIPTPFLTHTSNAVTSPTARLPLGYDLGADGSAAPENYLAELLVVRDSVVRRWGDRTANPIRVWVQSDPQLSAWDDSYPEMARQALAEWGALGLPVRFTLASDSATAEIHVVFADRLGEDESGRTVWWSTTSGWISRARISLSTHASDGLPQTAKALRAVALHEFGHALGLGHTNDARNIMAPWVEVAELSDADRNTALLLYQMAPGRVQTGTATQGNVGGRQRSAQEMPRPSAPE